MSSAASAGRLQAMLMYFVLPLIERELAHRPQPRLLGLLERISPAVWFMDEQFLANPSLERVAAVAHLSPSYFHRLFVDLYHSTPHDYMLGKRMRLARQRLSDGARVAEASQDAGYENVFYFSRIYKQHFGFSPRHTGDYQAVQP